jgi:hypothetical protein
MAATKERGETVSGYFRKVFSENPSLLEGRSNQEPLDCWLSKKNRCVPFVFRIRKRRGRPASGRRVTTV